MTVLKATESPQHLNIEIKNLSVYGFDYDFARLKNGRYCFPVFIQENFFPMNFRDIKQLLNIKIVF